MEHAGSLSPTTPEHQGVGTVWRQVAVKPYDFRLTKTQLAVPSTGTTFLSSTVDLLYTIGLFDEKFKELTHFMPFFSELNMAMFGTFDWFYTSAKGEFKYIPQMYIGICCLYTTVM